MKFGKYVPLFEDFSQNFIAGSDDLNVETIGDVIEKYGISLTNTITPSELLEKVNSEVVVFITGNKVNDYNDIDSDVYTKNQEIIDAYNEIGVTEIYNTYGGWREEDWPRPSLEPSLAVVAPEDMFAQVADLSFEIGNKYNQTSFILAFKGTPMMFYMNKNPKGTTTENMKIEFTFNQAVELHTEDDAPIGYTICGEGDSIGAIEFV